MQSWVDLGEDVTKPYSMNTMREKTGMCIIQSIGESWEHGQVRKAVWVKREHK